MRLSLRPRCTCGSTNNKHRFSCDLWYKKHWANSIPRKKKHFGLFFPLKRKKRK